jgi:hypothetical protein
MTLNMEEVHSFDISGFLRATRRYNPQERDLEDPFHLWLLINVDKLLRKYLKREENSSLLHYFYILSWVEMKLSPLGTSATV